jgi:nucleoid-associated protein YgaU
VYEVKTGDDLSRVAVNVYGIQQGKRWVNIKRIYEANKSVMPSMDNLKVGQKLTIPSLPADVVSPEPAVKSAPASSAPAVKAAAKPAVEKTSGYVVKDGDSLWKIAKERLGSGTRYKEIMKLNGLDEDSSLQTGMSLKLPVK